MVEILTQCLVLYPGQENWPGYEVNSTNNYYVATYTKVSMCFDQSDGWIYEL